MLGHRLHCCGKQCAGVAICTWMTSIVLRCHLVRCGNHFACMLNLHSYGMHCAGDTSCAAVARSVPWTLCSCGKHCAGMSVCTGVASGVLCHRYAQVWQACSTGSAESSLHSCGEQYAGASSCKLYMQLPDGPKGVRGDACSLTHRDTSQRCQASATTHGCPGSAARPWGRGLRAKAQGCAVVQTVLICAQMTRAPHA